MRMQCVLAPKLSEKLPCLDLQVAGQRRCQQIRLFQAHVSMAIGFEPKTDVAETAEIRVHRAIQGDFRALHGKAASRGIVVSQLKIFGRVGRGGPTESCQRAKA